MSPSCRLQPDRPAIILTSVGQFRFILHIKMQIWARTPVKTTFPGEVIQRGPLPGSMSVFIPPLRLRSHRPSVFMSFLPLWEDLG